MLLLDKSLKALRKEKNLTQKDVAEFCEIGYMTYRRYESGEREPTATVLWKMADLFEVSVDYLIGRSDER